MASTALIAPCLSIFHDGVLQDGTGAGIPVPAPPGAGGGIPDFRLVAGVSPSGGEFTSIQAANDALVATGLINLATGTYGLIVAGPGVYAEDVILSPGVHLTGLDAEATWIIGAGTVSGHLVTLSGNSSIQNFTISPAAAAYTSGIRIITSAAPPLLVDPRGNRNLNIYSGIGGTLVDAIRQEAVDAGIALVTFDGLTTFGETNSINTLAVSTQDVSIRDSKLLSGDILLDGSGELTLIGTDHTPVNDVIVNVDNVFKPIGSGHGTVIGSSTDPFVAGSKLAPVNQMVYRPGNAGFAANAQMDSVIENLTLRDKYPMPFFVGVPEVGDFIAGNATDGYEPGNAIIYKNADIECRTAPTGTDLIIKINDLVGTTDRKLTIPAGTNFAKALPVIRHTGNPDNLALPAEFSMEIEQQGSDIKAGDIAISFNSI